jgi:hypothetical protein
MRPALWQAVAERLKALRPSARLVATDHFNARVSLPGSTARLRLFYQPREGEVPGEARVWLTFDGTRELDTVAQYIEEQERLAKSAPHPLHFSQSIPKDDPGGVGDATLGFQTGVVSWHRDEMIARFAGYYAEGVDALLRVHSELTRKAG